MPGPGVLAVQTSGRSSGACCSIASVYTFSAASAMGLSTNTRTEADNQWLVHSAANSYSTTSVRSMANAGTARASCPGRIEARG